MPLPNKAKPPQATIGIVMPQSSLLGGAEALLLHLLQHGGSRFRYVCLFLEEGPLLDEARRLGYDTTVLAATRLTDFGNYWTTVRSLRRWIRKNQIDLVLSFMTKAHLYAGVAAFGLGVRRLWYQHGVTQGQMIDRVTTWVPADGVLCCSTTAAQAQSGLAPSRRTFVSYPGVAIPAMIPSMSEARNELGLPQTAPIIGMVARLERWKGAHVFAAAAERIWKRYPEAVLFVVGGAHKADPDYAHELEAQIGRLSRPHHFILVGQKPMSEVALWQAAADFHVHPAPLEPFGMAVVEAMGLGKTVIASNSGGPAEIIEQGVSGMLIDMTEDRLADAVVELLGDPERCNTLAGNARVRSEAFSVPAFVSRLEGILSQALGGQ